MPVKDQYLICLNFRMRIERAVYHVKHNIYKFDLKDYFLALNENFAQ